LWSAEESTKEEGEEEKWEEFHFFGEMKKFGFFLLFWFFGFLVFWFFGAENGIKM
jgi:hypothetical protein